ncbi:hypothetical protein SUDANB106_03678 [Streptomyces sp. enrichment culture]|uniref:DUF3592 domain-containing protein n=1 Tax=Streptomyces sp. enrichment culture TaxID=1795815 RepID=UPI003F569E62
MEVPGGERLFLALAAVLFGALAVRGAVRLLAVVRALRAGARAEAECVRVSSASRPTGTDLYHFAFRTPDGRPVEFEEYVSGVRVGDRVPVRYDPARPGRATVAGPGRLPPVVMPAVLAAGCGAAAVLLALAFVMTL